MADLGADRRNLCKGYCNLCMGSYTDTDSNTQAHTGTGKDSSNNSNLRDKDRDTGMGNSTDMASGRDIDMGFYNPRLSRRRCITTPGLKEI